MDRSCLQEEQQEEQQEEHEEELFEVQGHCGGRRSDIQRLWTELTRSLSEDVGTAEASVLAALQWIRESERNTVLENRLEEVEQILKNIISMSHQYSQSEAALTFVQTASLDSVQPFFQSPVTVADVWRSNGFCLANTETILYDAYLKEKESEKQLSVHSARRSSQVLTRTHIKQDGGLNCNAETATLNLADTGLQEPNHAATKPQNCIINLSFLQLEVCETDILE